MAYTELQCMMGRMRDPFVRTSYLVIGESADIAGWCSEPGAIGKPALITHSGTSVYSLAIVFLFSKMNRLGKVGVIWCVLTSRFFK